MRLIHLFVLLLPLVGVSQHGSKPKTSNGRGTMFGYIGYNRSSFSKSTINFIGPGYDFKLAGARAEDQPTDFNPAVQLNPMNFSIAQYNVRLGYYIRNKFAISVGYDKLKYVLVDQNQVLLSGTINPGVDPVNNWNGTYNNEGITTNQSTFDYRNAGALNYVRLELTRTDQWYEMGRKSWLVFSTNAGLGLGGLYSSTSFTFGGKNSAGVTSFSGLGISGHANLRFEFFRHVFFQTGFSGGFMQQFHVSTSTNEPNAYAKHHFGYGSFEAAVGFLLYIRPTNDCNSCPNW